MATLLTTKTRDLRSDRGIGLIEVIVGVSIIAVSLIGIIVAFILYFRATVDNTDAIQTSYLLEEGVEALRYLRGAGWDANIAPLSTSTPYYLAWSGTAWSVTPTEVAADKEHIRFFVLEDVFRREIDDDIIASTSAETKYLDLDIKHVTMTVIHASTSKETSVETYVANLFRN